MAVFDHVQIKVENLGRCRGFYEAVLGCLGYGVVLEGELFVGFGNNPHDMFEVSQADASASVSKATHLAFTADGEAAVRAFHATALKLGAKDNGPPGLRPRYEDGYFAAFVIDPNGHNLEAVYTSRPVSSPVADAGTEARYRRYIGHLNDRRTSELAEFVHERLTYNGQPMSRVEYQDLIARDIAAAPDLYFAVDLLVVDADQVACRLNFRCAPRGEFLGLQADGRSISFSEHVFYRLRDGKIYDVSSLIDRPAIERQLAQRSGVR